MAGNGKTREEQTKNEFRDKFFTNYDANEIIGDIDFAVTLKKNQQRQFFDTEYFLWAEAKAGNTADIYASFVQLIITIGKAKTHERLLPPKYLGAFDEEKVAFLEFHHIVHVFYQNDFNWNVTPSNHNSKEFHLLYDLLSNTLKKEISLFNLKKDERALHKFIRTNFKLGKERTSGINITKNNFIFVFQRWVEEVKPTINVVWEDIPKTSVVDFFYADLISRDDYTLREELAIVLRGDHYKILQEILTRGTPTFSEANFMDGMTAYRQFWNKYIRPPRKEYLDIILKRRDMLIPQDLRQYTGAFFTPPIWVQKSQEYIEKELGENWQQEYYVWDCCAGTGNLLFGLTEPYRLWASTLDNADVQVMKERIKEKGLNLLERHVFQFDFLNDSFDKLPDGLREIINDPEKRKRLVIYINPPYAEASDMRTLKGEDGKKSIEQTAINKKYASKLGQANAELFVQFFIRINYEIPTSVLAAFSTLKTLQGPHFVDFRRNFRAKLGRFFCVPADSFDNVKGQFPIGFMIWQFDEKERFTSAQAVIYNKKGELIGNKTFQAYDDSRYMNDWVKRYRGIKTDKDIIGKFPFKGNDFQNQRIVQIVHNNMEYNKAAGQFLITPRNLIIACIYFAVRKSIKATWLNDRDQFLYPKENWENDKIFQGNCLVYSLFNNYIQSQYGINYWIPFSEKEVGAQDSFDSHFMHDFIMGKTTKKTIPKEGYLGLNYQSEGESPSDTNNPIVFSETAIKAMDAARELWKYYHSQPNANPNASFYDIRLHFQGTKTIKGGKIQMNSESSDPTYTQLLATLRKVLKDLAAEIEPRVYEYGFLKK